MPTVSRAALAAPPLPERLTAGISRLATVLRGQAWQKAGGLGVTPTQGQILSLLAANADGVRLSRVAEELGVTAATASDAVSTLVDKGLVRKARARDDARALTIVLTARGRRHAEQVRSWPELMLTAVDTLTPDEQRVLLRVIIKLIRTLQEEGQVSVARMCVTCEYFRPHAHAGARPHHCDLVDARLADDELRLECPDQVPADDAKREHHWQLYALGPVGVTAR